MVMHFLPLEIIAHISFINSFWLGNTLYTDFLSLSVYSDFEICNRALSAIFENSITNIFINILKKKASGNRICFLIVYLQRQYALFVFPFWRIYESVWGICKRHPRHKQKVKLVRSQEFKKEQTEVIPWWQLQKDDKAAKKIPSGSYRRRADWLSYWR